VDVAETTSLSPAAVSRRAPAGRWLVAGVLMLAVVFGFFDRISVAVLFTWVPFQHAMGTGFNPARLGLLMTVFLLAYGVSAIFLSFSGDLFGHRRSLAVSSAIWGIAMGAMGLVNSYGLMLAGRALLGLAEGPQFSFASALVRRWFPRHEQARASSLWLVGSPLGSALGFPLVGFLVTSYGWRAAFYALAALNLLIVLPLILTFVRDWPPGAVPVAEEKPTSAQYRSTVASLLREWRFWVLVLFNLGALIYLWGLNAWLPTYLVKARGIDLRSAGFLASAPFIFMFVGEVGGALLSDRIGRHALVAACGMLLAAGMMYVGTLMPDATSAVLAMGVSALGWGVAIPTYFALTLRVLPPGAVAAGVGVFNGVGNLAGAAAPVAIGVVIASTGSFESGLMVLVGAPLLAAVSLLSLAVMRYGR
jgi:MFS family permease